MEEVRTLEEAKAKIEAAGFRYDDLRSYGPEGYRAGYAFSIESLRRCYGHPQMEVRIAPETSR